MCRFKIDICRSLCLTGIYLYILIFIHSLISLNYITPSFCLMRVLRFTLEEMQVNAA